MPLAPQEIRTFFITTTTANRRRIFQVERNAELFLDVLQQNRTKERMRLHAFVVMPDHVHLLLTPAPDISLEKAMQFIKGSFSFRLQSKLDVWNRSFNEHRIRTRDDFENHRIYIEQNPVRANLVKDASEYKFSSLTALHLIDPSPAHIFLVLKQPPA
jgi:putative transposase